MRVDQQQSLFGSPDVTPPRVVVLVSIQQPYFQQMVDGTKRFEFRRKYLREPSEAFVYVPAPLGCVAGRVTFETPIVAPVEEIAALAEQQRPGGGDAIKEYMGGLAEGFAVPVRSIQTFAPVPLKKLREISPDFVAPQFYYLLDRKPELLKFLRQHSLQ